MGENGARLRRGGGSSDPEGTRHPSTSGTDHDTPSLWSSSPSSSISSPCPKPGCFTRQRNKQVFLPQGIFPGITDTGRVFTLQQAWYQVTWVCRANQTSEK